MKQKKTQIFMFDFIFSVIILIVTLGVIFSYTINTTSNDEIYKLNLQIIESFTQTKVNALNDERIRDMFKDFNTRKLINIENTLAQQTVQFYYLGDVDLARNLTLIFIGPYVKQNYNFNLTLTTQNDSIVLFSKIGVDDTTKENAKLASRIERVILGYVNRTELYQGYVVSLDIWI